MTMSVQKMKLANRPSQFGIGASVRVRRPSVVAIAVDRLLWDRLLAFQSCLSNRTFTGPWYSTYEWVTG